MSREKCNRREACDHRHSMQMTKNFRKHDPSSPISDGESRIHAEKGDREKVFGILSSLGVCARSDDLAQFDRGKAQARRLPSPSLRTRAAERNSALLIRVRD